MLSLHALFESWSAATGVRLDLYTTLFCILYGIPFCFVWNRLPFPILKHLTAIASSLYLIQFSYGYKSILIILGLIVPVYFFAKWKLHHYWGIAYCLLFHAICCLYRMYIAYLDWTMDWTSVIMMVFPKCTMFLWDVYDGRKKEEEMYPHQKLCCLREIPSIWEYLGYVLFPCTILTGPCFEMYFYLAAANPDKYDKTKDKAPHPNRLWTVLWRLIVAGCSFGFFFVELPFDIGKIGQPEFLQKPFLVRALHCHVGVWLYRIRYLGSWLIAEANCISAGIGWDGKNWEAVRSIRILGVELAHSPQQILENWNCSIQRWLKYYWYTRGPRDAKGRPASWMVYITFLVSAIWHGFYPGYYLYFSSVAMFVYMHRAFVASVLGRPVKNNTSAAPQHWIVRLIKWVPAWMITHGVLNYLGLCFLLLAWDQSVEAFRNVNWWGHYAILAGFLVSQLAGWLRGRNKKQPHHDKAQ